MEMQLLNLVEKVDTEGKSNSKFASGICSVIQDLP